MQYLLNGACMLHWLNTCFSTRATVGAIGCCLNIGFLSLLVSCLTPSKTFHPHNMLVRNVLIFRNWAEQVIISYSRTHSKLTTIYHWWWTWTLHITSVKSKSMVGNATKMHSKSQTLPPTMHRILNKMCLYVKVLSWYTWEYKIICLPFGNAFKRRLLRYLWIDSLWKNYRYLCSF